jgi:hypothetical protein
MRRPTIYLQILVLAACVAVLTSQLVVYAQEPDEEEDVRLPSGKLQKDEILRLEYKQNLEDAGRLLDLAQSLKAQLETGGYRVVSAKSIKGTEEIEQLAKRIRNRLRKY